MERDPALADHDQVCRLRVEEQRRILSLKPVRIPDGLERLERTPTPGNEYGACSPETSEGRVAQLIRVSARLQGHRLVASPSLCGRHGEAIEGDVGQVAITPRDLRDVTSILAHRRNSVAEERALPVIGQEGHDRLRGPSADDHSLIGARVLEAGREMSSRGRTKEDRLLFGDECRTGPHEHALWDGLGASPPPGPELVEGRGDLLTSPLELASGTSRIAVETREADRVSFQGLVSEKAQVFGQIGEDQYIVLVAGAFDHRGAPGRGRCGGRRDLAKTRV